MNKKSSLRVLNSRSDNLKSKIQNLKWGGIVAIVVTFPMCGAVAHAQQPMKVPRIGYVSTNGDPSNPPPFVEAFRLGLRDFGYSEGKNILVEYRYAEGKLDRVPGLVTELVQLNVDALVLGTQTALRAAKQATKTIPIIMVNTADPVATGIVDSLARPGGNITGVSTLSRELGGKRMELLKEIAPRISRVGVLWHADGVTAPLVFKEIKPVARALKLQLHALELHGQTPDFDEAFKAAAKAGVNALITDRAPVFNRFAKRLAELTIKNRFPSMYAGIEYVEAGGLASYASNSADQYRRAAYYVDKILKGTKPGELPVEQPTKFEFVINLKTGKQLGLTIPQEVLARADKVIK